jgi:hypothetical protein
VDDESGSHAVAVPGRSGGGWRALLADVLGVSGTLTAELVTVLTAPSEASDPWCPAALDETWRLAHAADVVGHANDGSTEPTPDGELSEAG